MKKRTTVNTMLSLLIAGAIWSAPHHVEAQARPQHPVLDSLESFYEQAESVHFRAVLDVSVRLPLYEGHATPVSGHGLIEHWEQDGMFRTKVWVDPRLGLGDNLEIAYDGIKYQLYWPDTGVLAIEDPQFMANGLMFVPGPVPNPLYLPVAHLAPSDDQCPGCQLTLGFLNNAENWAEKMSTMNSFKATDPVFHLSGGSRAGEAYTFQVNMRAAESLEVATKSLSDISRIDRLRPDGRIITSVVLLDSVEIPAKNLSDDKPLRFPKEIRLLGYDPDQPAGEHIVTRVDYAIEQLEVGSDIDYDVFVIEQEKAVAVWEKGVEIRKRSP